jgi:hypothetical protein
MNKKKNVTEIENKRMLTTTEAETYTGLGKGLCRKWCESIGAVRKIGTRVLFDKFVIDAVMDQMAKDTQAQVTE